MIIDLETQVCINSADYQQNHLITGISRRCQHGTEPDVWLNQDTSPAAHDEAMKCVDVSVILGFRSKYLDTYLPHESVASFVGKAPHRRIGFAGIDPMENGALDMINQAVDLGLSGITISPALQNFHPSHSKAIHVYEHCNKLGLPILVRHGEHLPVKAIMEYTNPIFFDEIARNFPRLKIVIGHVGFPFMDETLALISKHDNMYTDMAGVASQPWRLYNLLLSAFESNVMDKLLFASNFPYDTPEQTIERIYSLNRYSHGTSLPSIPRQLLRGIVERDALDCLGLERPEGASISSGIGKGLEPIHDKQNKVTHMDNADVQVNTLSELINRQSKSVSGNIDAHDKQ